MKTLVIGASTNPERYSYKATSRLKSHGHEVVPLGIREGAIEGINIKTSKEDFEGIDTVTMYLNPQRQEEYYDYIKSLHPRRVIFNPGTENSEFQEDLVANGIEVENACTLVLLSVGNY